MLAKVPSSSSEEISVAPTSFTATFHHHPASFLGQFSFTDVNGAVFNLVHLEGQDPVEIVITLEGATFSATELDWALIPEGGEPHVHVVNEQTRSFTVPPPAHVLSPWAFGIIVDTPEVKGIRSQNIFLAKPPAAGPQSIKLQYDPDDGSFLLLDEDSSQSSTQNGFLLGSQLFVINASVPSQEPTFSITVDFLSPLSGASIVFAENPVVWSSGSSPTWVTAQREDPQNEVTTLTIHPETGGHSVGFSFAVEVTIDETTTTVISPDPILINATIGDG